MNPIHPLFALAAVLLALITAYGLGRAVGFPQAQGRFAAIDGLRGFLAFGVFLHHSAYWFYYRSNGTWVLPPDRLFHHLGESSVRLFFMITAFLFFSKILDARTRDIDWTRLFVSRVLRLVPMYLFVVGLLLLCVAVVSRFTLHVPLNELLRQIACWIGFTVAGNPDVNGVRNTSVMVAGVTWSLPFEWFFYFGLPLLAFFLRRRVAPAWLVFSIVVTAAALCLKPQLVLASSFLGGILAASLVRMPRAEAIAKTPLASLALIGTLILTVVAFDRGWGAGPLAALSIAFALIACGNNLFGILTSRVARFLGEISYSIYLLHGMVLFVTFEFVIGLDRAAQLSQFAFWAVILCCTPVLLLCSYLTFRFIEAPPMQQVSSVTAWLRSFRAKTIVAPQ